MILFDIKHEILNKIFHNKMIEKNVDRILNMILSIFNFLNVVKKAPIILSEKPQVYSNDLKKIENIQKIINGQVFYFFMVL